MGEHAAIRYLHVENGHRGVRGLLFFLMAASLSRLSFRRAVWTCRKHLWELSITRKMAGQDVGFTDLLVGQKKR